MQDGQDVWIALVAGSATPVGDADSRIVLRGEARITDTGALPNVVPR